MKERERGGNVMMRDFRSIKSACLKVINMLRRWVEWKESYQDKAHSVWACKETVVTRSIAHFARANSTAKFGTYNMQIKILFVFFINSSQIDYCFRFIYFYISFSNYCIDQMYVFTSIYMNILQYTRMVCSSVYFLVSGSPELKIICSDEMCSMWVHQARFDARTY